MKRILFILLTLILLIDVNLFAQNDLELGINAYNLSNFSQAFKYLSSFINDYPDIAKEDVEQAYYYRALTLYKLKKYTDEISDLNKLIDQNDHNENYYYNRALAYSLTGKLDRATTDIDKALIISNDYKYYYIKGYVDLKKNLYDMAITEFNKVLKAEPLNERSLRDRGWAYYYKKEYVKAIKDWETVTTLNPLLTDEGTTKTISQFLAQLKEGNYAFDDNYDIKKESNVNTQKQLDIGKDKIKSDIDNVPKTGNVNNDGFAIVIGNRDYFKKDVPPVEFAIDDALLAKDYLVNSFGYKSENIIVLSNATQGDFIATFGAKDDYKGKLYDLIKPGKSDVFIYYNGHGAPDISTKESYFVPVDCDPERVRLNGYSLSTFYENLSKLDCKSMTIVIDACFSGGSDKGMLIHNASPIYVTPDNDITAKENTFIFTSAKGDQISSWYTDMGHSLFTYYFLYALQGNADSDKDKKITLKDMVDYLKDNVTGTARKLYGREQIPVIKGDENKVFYSY